MRKVSTTILTSLFVLALEGYAQNITGSMSGRVVDASGAAVPDAVVTATEPAKLVNIRTVTTKQGEFSLAGLPLALLLARFVGKLLYQVPTLDPASVAATVALVALGGAAASLLPARRAARVDPLIALRLE